MDKELKGYITAEIKKDIDKVNELMKSANDDAAARLLATKNNLINRLIDISRQV
jgi:hypothetical protein